MGVFNTSNIKIGAGTLYAAPLGTTEPTAVTGAWPTSWYALGYTDQGSTFAFGPATSPVEVEELYWPVYQAITSYSGKMTFILSETTRQNLALALNAGIGSTTVGATQGSNTDGSLWQEAPAPGSEVRVMLGWDALALGTPAADISAGADPYTRIIVRQALQTGQVTRMARKGNNKSMFACEFSLEFPRTGLQPFRFIEEPNLAA
jgi:hypothetical protein